ncbi:MAG: hypothetical protein COT17_03305 [Elusimicrobia bacterium CG08_land_8_20_14_0_20_51_18]|nr:MAG: hypothetical protein COT17_03305 [Elusimicrobia bacterium CG08_land_8_20_14_0_20_51_18]
MKKAPAGGAFFRPLGLWAGQVVRRRTRNARLKPPPRANNRTAGQLRPQPHRNCEQRHRNDGRDRNATANQPRLRKAAGRNDTRAAPEKGARRSNTAGTAETAREQNRNRPYFIAGIP